MKKVLLNLLFFGIYADDSLQAALKELENELHRSSRQVGGNYHHPNQHNQAYQQPYQAQVQQPNQQPVQPQVQPNVAQASIQSRAKEPVDSAQIPHSTNGSFKLMQQQNHYILFEF